MRGEKLASADENEDEADEDEKELPAGAGCAGGCGAIGSAAAPRRADCIDDDDEADANDKDATLADGKAGCNTRRELVCEFAPPIDAGTLLL